MSDEVPTPAVIDLQAMSQPVSEDSPSGESLRYEGLYDSISEARRADDELNQGEWQTEVKVAEFDQVVDLAVPALTSTTKDLQIAAWLSEALIKIHGFSGLRDSLRLMAILQDQFWDTVHPVIEDGDMEGRANAVSWLDAQGATAVKTIPFTGGPGYSYIDWMDAKTFDIPSDIESLDADAQEKFNRLKEQAESQGRVTAEMWKLAVAKTRRAECEATNFTIDECWEALKDLNRVIDERYDRKQMPGLGALQKSLDDVHGQVKKLLEKKRIEEPDAVNLSDIADTDSEGAVATQAGGGNSVSGPVGSRADALRKLAEIAAFFQRTEPHSPIAYLVQRAVKWGNMPLETWLQDVIKDESVLFQLRQTLGLDTSSMAGDGWGAGSNEESSGDESTESTDSSSDDW